MKERIKGRPVQKKLTRVTMARDRIKGRLAQKGLTQTAMADELGWTPKHMSEVINGKQGTSLVNIQKIAQFLDTSVGYLLGETDDPAPAAKTRKTAGVLGTKRSLAADIIESYLGKNETKFRKVLEVIDDPEKMALVLLLDGMAKEEVRKAFDFISDQKIISKVKKSRSPRKISSKKSANSL